MANSDKNIIITPNTGQTAEPTIKFTGANNTPTTLRVLDDGTVSFEGTAGQLFSISDGLTGTIFSVNDISGIPSIEVLDTGEVRIAQYNGNVGIGMISPSSKLHITAPSASTIGLIVSGAASHSVNLQEWRSSAGTAVVRVDNGFAIRSTAAGYGYHYNDGSSQVGRVVAYSDSVGTVPFISRGTAGQTGDLQQWQNSAGTNLVTISPSGVITSSLATGTAPLSIASTTLVSNLNADYLDGNHGSYYLDTSATAQTKAGDLTISGNLTVTGNVKSFAGVLDQSINFAAAGSVLDNLPARIHPGEQLLKEAVWWIDAAHSSAGSQTIQNLGWGGSILNARAGSSTSADSNDPKYLDWMGENYVYLPGVSGNYLSVPDEAAFDMAGKTSYEVRVRLTRDDWTNGNGWIVNCSNGNNGFRWQFLGGYFRFGTAAAAVNSTTTHGITSGSTTWVKAAWDATNVSFFTSANGTDWTQVGTAVAHGITWINPPVPMTFGGDGTSLDGKFHRMVYTIDGTPVLDIDTSVISTGAATTFTALTGQTVTINRSTTGRKSVCVVHPVWLLGSDDYLEVPDNALIDFGASDSFTVIVAARDWGSDTTTRPYMSKGDSTATGFLLYRYAGTTYAEIDDGTTSITDTITTTSSTIMRTLVRNTSSDNLTVYGDATASGSPTTDTTTGTLANSEPLRIGRLVGGIYGDFEFVASAVFRRALTASEIATLTAYYQGRVGA